MLEILVLYFTFHCINYHSENCLLLLLLDLLKIKQIPHTQKTAYFFYQKLAFSTPKDFEAQLIKYIIET